MSGLKIRLGLDEDVLVGLECEFEFRGIAVAGKDRVSVLDPKFADTAGILGDAGDDLELESVDDHADIVDQVEAEPLTGRACVAAAEHDHFLIEAANTLVYIDQPEDLAAQLERGMVGSKLLELSVERAEELVDVGVGGGHGVACLGLGGDCLWAREDTPISSPGFRENCAENRHFFG